MRNYIENLKDNKGFGFDKVSNEFFKYGICENLVRIFKSLFESIITCGFIPNDFYIAILRPITIREYRPYSISIVLAGLFGINLARKYDISSWFESEIVRLQTKCVM